MMKKPPVLVFMLVLLCATGSVACAQQTLSPYHLDKKIKVPGDGGWDYLTVDTVHRRLFVSHGNAVNVISLNTGIVEATIDGLEGVHGVAIATDLNRGFISEGQGNRVTVFDLSTLRIKARVPVTGKDPDCILYDPFSRRIFTFNGDSKNATAIDARTLKVLGTIRLGGSPEFAVSDGKGKIYNNLEDVNELVVLDPKSLSVLKRVTLTPCEGPTALALDRQHQRLFTACRGNRGLSVLDASTGGIITTLPIGAGVDAARYDPRTGLVFASSGDGTVTIIHEDAPDRYRVVQTLDIAPGARTMGFDPRTGKIFLSVGRRDLNQRGKVVPGTFNVLVFSN